MQRATRATHRLVPQGFPIIGRHGQGFRRKGRLQPVVERQGCGRLPRRHFGDPRFRLGNKLGDQTRLGQVLPVFFRHLRLHRLHLEAGGIEDVGIIDAPKVVGRVFRLRPRSRLRRHRQPFTVPGSRALRRGDQPIHVGEAPLKERRGAGNDKMLRLEPGDEAPARARRRDDLPKPDEGRHLVGIAAHGFFHRPGSGHIRIRMHPQEQALLMHQSPQQPIQQRKTRRIAVTDGGGGEVEKGGRHGRRLSRAARRHRQGVEI